MAKAPEEQTKGKADSGTPDQARVRWATPRSLSSPRSRLRSCQPSPKRSEPWRDA